MNLKVMCTFYVVSLWKLKLKLTTGIVFKHWNAHKLLEKRKKERSFEASIDTFFYFISAFSIAEKKNLYICTIEQYTMYKFHFETRVPTTELTEWAIEVDCIHTFHLCAFSSRMSDTHTSIHIIQLYVYFNIFHHHNITSFHLYHR